MSFIKIATIAACQNIWADSTIETLLNMKRGDLISQINFNELYANFIFSFPSNANLAYSVCENKLFLRCYTYYAIIKRIFKAIARRTGWTLHLIPMVKLEKNIQTIIEASNKLEELCNKEVS